MLLLLVQKIDLVIVPFQWDFDLILLDQISRIRFSKVKGRCSLLSLKTVWYLKVLIQEKRIFCQIITFVQGL